MLSNTLRVSIVRYPISCFLLTTVSVSLISFVLMTLIPNAHTPESITGLPIWLIAIWSPNLAASFIWLVKKEFKKNVKTSYSVSITSWDFIAFTPMAVAGLLLLLELIDGTSVNWSNFKLSYLIPLIVINLFMGPLGEELGWRGFLYPALKQKLGWFNSSILVGVIWAMWHAPLWFIDSPQSKIPFWAFTLNVVVLSILMGIIHNHSSGSILAIVLLHLTFNLSLGIVDILGSHSPSGFVIKGLFLYLPICAFLVVFHERIRNKNSMQE